MSKTRKLSALLLVFALIVAILPTGAIAAEAAETASSGTIKVQSLHSKDGSPIAGAILWVYDQYGTIKDQMVTDAKGEATSITLKAGTYTVRLLWAPEGYAPDVTSRVVEIKWSENPVAPFTLSKQNSIVIYANEEDGTPVPSAKYLIIDTSTGLEVESVTTDTSGIATSKLLKDGTYIVKQHIVPEGYTLASALQVKVVIKGETATVARFHHFTKSSIYIRTLDILTGFDVGGAQYSVDNLNGNHVGIFTADEDGKVTIKNLAPGKYLVKQVVQPSAYALCTESQFFTITSEETYDAKFYNYQLSGIVIESVVQESHTPLEGSIFEIYDADAKLIFHGTTTETGLLNTGELPAGIYNIKYVYCPDGYHQVETMKTVDVTVNHPTHVVFENTTLTALYIELIDNITKEHLTEGTFKIQTVGGNFVEEVEIKDGFAVIPTLPVGKYMVTQLTTGKNYVLEASYQWAEIKSGYNTRLLFTNEKISSIVVYSIERGSNVGLSGSTFAIYEQNGKFIGEFTTTASGIIQTDSLEPGVYLIKQTKISSGYLSDTETQTVTVTTDKATVVKFNHVPMSVVTVQAVETGSKNAIPGMVFNLTKMNGDFIGQYKTAANGKISLPDIAPGKYILTPVSVPTNYILNSTPHTIEVKANTPILEVFTFDLYSGVVLTCTVEQTGKPLSNVTFRITTLEGRIIGDYQTNKNGQISLDLAPGDYIAYETYCPSGFVLNAEPINFRVVANSPTIVKVENKKISEIAVKVVDSETLAPIPNVRLEVKDYTNNHIGAFKTDNDGYFYISQVLKDGRYILTMESVPDTHLKDNVPKTVIVDISDPTEVVWKINPVKGQIQITTLSDSDSPLSGIRKGSRLANAVYTITNQSGTVVKTIQSNSYGEAFSGALPVGTYYIQQTTAPGGFMINGQKVTVNVTSASMSKTITIYNKAAQIAMGVEAKGEQSAHAGTQMKLYFPNVKNASSYNVNNFYLNITVPTDAVRAGTFYTGTWSSSTAYYVEYKTNLSGAYKTLATGLSSQSQYSYDLSTIALKLGVNEYVTEIRMVFPTVVAGFHDNMSPALYATVLPTIPNGYQIITRAEVGGQMGSQWVTNAASWTTLATNPWYVSGGNSVNGNGGIKVGNGNGVTGLPDGTYQPGYIYYPGYGYYPYGYNPLPSTLPKTGY